MYLIGSTARGDARPDSDLDFLVVLPEDAPPNAEWRRGLYERLRGIPLSNDVIRVRRSEFDKTSNWLMSLPAIALREGKLEYDAATGTN